MDPRQREDRRRFLPWAFVLSVILHAILLPLALLWAWQRLPLPLVQQKPQILMIQSSVIRLEHKVVRPAPKPRPAVVRHPESPVVHPAVIPPPHRELAVLVPKKAKPNPPVAGTSSVAAQLAIQEQQFARTAAQLHAANNPLGGTETAAAPSSLHRSYFDAKPAPNGYYAILIPTKHWFSGNSSCYYTNYHTQFDGGGNEDGAIPWPVCYPRSDDKMLPLNHPHSLPVPVPPPGFVLPADSYLTPFLKDIYDERNPSG